MRFVKCIVKNSLLGLVYGYRWCISPLLPRACRFEPSCSEYAATALQLHGPVKGSMLTAKRLCRCHPWGGNGVDPVPQILHDKIGDKKAKPL